MWTPDSSIIVTAQMKADEAYRATIPSEVSPAQAEIALYNAGMLDAVNALLDTYPYEPVRIWWRKATYISRNHPYLEAVAIELDLSDETVDGLFKAASIL